MPMYIHSKLALLGLNSPRDLMDASSPATSLIVGLILVLFGFTGFGIYTSFGPPSKQLEDPFDEHDD